MIDILICGLLVILFDKWIDRYSNGPEWDIVKNDNIDPGVFFMGWKVRS